MSLSTAKITSLILQQKFLIALMQCALMSTPSSRAAQPCVNQIYGPVVRVIDGDTLVMLSQAGQKIMIRLAGIDAPEKRMPFGKAARVMLLQLVSSERLTACTIKTDRYGRTIATVFSGGEDVNLELVKWGLAWHYKRYSSEQSAVDAQTYAKSEAEAKARVIGLWQDMRPVPPWIFRRCNQTSGCNQLDKN